jgi:hypothetical protein
MKKIFIAGVLLLLASGLHAQAFQNTKPKGKINYALEDKIMDTILFLPEVKNRDAYIRKKTNGKRHLATVIYLRPEKERPYYVVKAWEDNGYAFATHFNFYVYPQTMKIKYLDVMHDKAIDLKTWRKHKKRF